MPYNEPIQLIFHLALSHPLVSFSQGSVLHDSRINVCMQVLRTFLIPVFLCCMLLREIIIDISTLTIFDEDYLLYKGGPR